MLEGQQQEMLEGHGAVDAWDPDKVVSLTMPGDASDPYREVSLTPPQHYQEDEEGVPWPANEAEAKQRMEAREKANSWAREQEAHGHEPNVLQDGVVWPDGPHGDPLAEVKWKEAEVVKGKKAQEKPQAAEEGEEGKGAEGFLNTFAKEAAQAAIDARGVAEKSMRKIRASVADKPQQQQPAQDVPLPAPQEEGGRGWRVAAEPPQPPEEKGAAQTWASSDISPAAKITPPSAVSPGGAAVWSPAAALREQTETANAVGGGLSMVWSTAMWCAAILLCFLLGWAAGVNMRDGLSSSGDTKDRHWWWTPGATPSHDLPYLSPTHSPSARGSDDTEGWEADTSGVGKWAGNHDLRAPGGILTTSQSSSRRTSLQSVCPLVSHLCLCVSVVCPFVCPFVSHLLPVFVRAMRRKNCRVCSGKR